MATGVQVLTDQTSGAPALFATPGSLVACLDWILHDRAGWEIVLTATNKRVYRAPAGVRHYLRVEDGINNFGAIVATFTGYETMTGIDTGTNPYAGANDHFQGSSGAGPEPWVAVVDDRTVTWLHKRTPGPVHGYEILHFGDLRRRNAGDPHRSILVAKSYHYVKHLTGALNVPSSEAGAGWVTPRNSAGTYGPYRTGTSGGSQSLCVYTDPARGSEITSGTEPYPGVDGRGVLARLHVGDATNVKHLGWCRGLWAVKCSSGTFADRDTGVGAGALAGRTFLFLRDLTDNNGATAYGPACLETSDTWDTV
jgi:hypothetical protein